MMVRNREYYLSIITTGVVSKEHLIDVSIKFVFTQLMLLLSLQFCAFEKSVFPLLNPQNLFSSLGINLMSKNSILRLANLKSTDYSKFAEPKNLVT